MPQQIDKIMFEIYREAAPEGRYRVVYFTELDQYNRESEISRAMHGEHIFNGFLRNQWKDQAKQVVSSILDHLNNGEKILPADIERELKTFLT